MPRLREEAVTWREVDGEIVALELSTSTYLAVNTTGAILWPALAEGASEQELAQRLVESYTVEFPQAARDVDSFLATLRDRGLLEE